MQKAQTGQVRWGQVGLEGAMGVVPIGRVAGLAGRAVESVAPRAAAEGGEIFFRTMNESHFSRLVATGRMPGTSETFISPTRKFSESYGGVLVEFNLHPGTHSALVRVGVRDASDLVVQKFPDMPSVAKGWTSTAAYFKGELEQINIGLGRGPALSVFNDGILSYRRLR